jgi:KaiC/GvpD/RAD55 family RecA-like ATPase
MDLEKQRLLISLIASNRDLMALCSGILKPSYFDPSLKKTVKFMKDYFENYRDIPKLETIRAETGSIIQDAGKIERADIAYVSKEVEDFCKFRAATEVLLSAPELLQKGDAGKILDAFKDALAVGLAKDMGIRYFQDPEERLRRTLIQEAKISTGWPELDAVLGGGIARQELILFAANSGGGKSMTMLNLARNLLAQGYNGIYVSLEMAEGVVSKRLDSMISHIAQENLLKELQKVAAAITNASQQMGELYIKRMVENRTNINHIRSYIAQLEQQYGFIPDFIVVDYVDIMGTTHSISLDNLFIKDKYVTEEIRSLGFDFNAMMISASQLGRFAIDAEKLTQAHIQGGISKINTSDYTVAIKQDDLMRAAGEIYFEILKSRNSGGVGQRLLLGWDPISLLINSLQRGKASLQLKKKSPVVLGGGTSNQSSPTDNRALFDSLIKS